MENKKQSSHKVDDSFNSDLSNRAEISNFFKVALMWKGAATPKVIMLILYFVLYSVLVDIAHVIYPWPGLDITPFEVFGAVLGVLIVFRTNAGYDRWWEARKIWGGIVNQSRNLALVGLNYGPKNKQWQKEFVKWIACFPYACMESLRFSTKFTEIKRVLTDEEHEKITKHRHVPLAVASEIARLVEQAKTQGDFDGFEYMEIEKHRALLIDYIGACERILKTPMPLVYAIKVRRFILFYLLTLPFAIAPLSHWVVPFAMLFVAYPLLSLDLIGYQLQNPFSRRNLSHLPLDNICQAIQDNVFELLVEDPEKKADMAELVQEGSDRSTSN